MNIQAPGYVVQSEALPIQDLKSIGCTWVALVYGGDRTQAEMLSVVKHYAEFPIVLVCKTMAEAEIASKWPVQVALYSEPDMKDQADMTPSQVAVAYAKFGSNVWGPGICNVVTSADWWNTWLSLKVKCKPAIHGYGLSLAQLAKELKAIGGICTEYGWNSDATPEQAMEVILSGLPVAIYQAPLMFFESTRSGWVLNAAGQRLAAMLRVATLPPAN